MADERLQKFLARGGAASRRGAEVLIAAGRVKVNQRVVTELGTKVDPARDLVTLDGKLVSAPEVGSYFLLYKPSGCVTTAADPEGRPTAMQYMAAVRTRVFPVGRLDYDAEGAVLFTDDGELANRLAHPRYGHQRVYLVKVRGEPDPRALERMVAGVRLEDGLARALEVGVHERADKNVWIRMVVGEGRFHLVKRLCEAVGLSVQRLFRPEFGGISVQGLRAGEFRALTPAEVRELRQRVMSPDQPSRPDAQGVKLPRAARRHGHGPPPVPGAETPAAPGRGARPPGARPSGDRPSGDRPSGARPTGARPSPARSPARKPDRSGGHAASPRGPRGRPRGRPDRG